MDGEGRALGAHAPLTLSEPSPQMLWPSLAAPSGAFPALSGTGGAGWLPPPSPLALSFSPPNSALALPPLSPMGPPLRRAAASAAVRASPASLLDDGAAAALREASRRRLNYLTVAGSRLGSAQIYSDLVLWDANSPKQRGLIAADRYLL